MYSNKHTCGRSRKRSNFLFTFWEWERARAAIGPTAAVPSQPDCPGVSRSDHSAGSVKHTCGGFWGIHMFCNMFCDLVVRIVHDFYSAQSAPLCSNKHHHIGLCLETNWSCNQDNGWSGLGMTFLCVYLEFLSSCKNGNSNRWDHNVWGSQKNVV